MVAAAVVALVLTAQAPTREWSPPAAWLVEAKCVHTREAPWKANTGNGYFGGFQFAAQTWRRVGGARFDAFAHPGDPAHPFRATRAEQLYRAWVLWKRDGGTWRKSWGAVGAACSQD